MANQVNVYVKNRLRDEIWITYGSLVGGSDLEPIAGGDEDRFVMRRSELSFTINTPTGTDIRGCSLMVRADVDVLVKCSRSNSIWSIKIEPDDLPTDEPTTVNITIDDGEPGD